MEFLLATTNKAKIRYYGSRLNENGITFVTPTDLNLDLEVDENGKDPIENAIMKARAYYERTGLPSIAIDEGLFLDNVPDEIQPGTHVRRVNGHRLNDEEMIEYYTSLVNKFGKDGRLHGYYLKAVAIVNGSDVRTYEYKDICIFSNKQSQIIDEGYPLASIRIIPQFNKFKSELTKAEEEQTIDVAQKPILEFMVNSVKELEQHSTNLTR